MPGVGWAAGVDRLVLLSQLLVEFTRPIVLVPLGQVAEDKAILMAYQLRGKGFKIDLGYTGSLSKRLKKANKNQARLAVIFGDDELESGTVTVRDLDSGKQEPISITALEDYLLREL